MPAAPPDILLIMTDQHSRNVLGAYGNDVVRTPHLDGLADAGMRFDNTYCASPWCVPSRMSFMTCRTPSRNRVWTNDQILSSGVPTWAHVLGGADYETALLGRMHFVGPDQRHGFEQRPIGEFMAGHPGAPVPGGPMWTHFPAEASGQGRVAVETVGHGHTHYQWGDEQVADAAVAFLRERGRQQSRRPFAAVVSLMLPHCPFIAPRSLFEHYRDRVDVPAAPGDQPAVVTRFRRCRQLLDPPVAPERVRLARAAYFALCEYVDSLIGRVLTAVEAAGLTERTLVMYCSDHGEMAGEHGCWWKTTYYESSVAVPLIARWPGVIAPGSSCRAIANLMDLGVTMADVAGAPFPGEPDGRSLRPWLAGGHPADWIDETFSEMADTRLPAPVAPSPSRMIRSGRWKLQLHADADELPPVLFDLDADPGETRDLAADPDHAAVRSRLLRRLREGWDPATIRAEAIRQIADSRVIADWGRAVRPAHPDTLTMIDAAYEADVVLV